MSHGENWTRTEQLAAFRLYCRTPFGKLHAKNPEIKALANCLGRTPSAVAKKACNFASLDPVIQARGIKGLGNTAWSDKQLWAEFLSTPTEVAELAEAAFASVQPPTEIPGEPEYQSPSGPTESVSLVRTRRVQSFFRASVLVSYESRCAISGATVPDLLVASHIIPWSEDECRRADPRNGVCLNALYDRAFDRGFITFADDLRIIVSPRLRISSASAFHKSALLEIDGAPLQPPVRFAPDPAALAYHRQFVFRDG